MDGPLSGAENDARDPQETLAAQTFARKSIARSSLHHLTGEASLT